MSEAETVLDYEVRWEGKNGSVKSFKTPSRVTATNKAIAQSESFVFSDLGEWQVGDGETDLLIQRWRYENGKEIEHEMLLKNGKEITRQTTNAKLAKAEGKAVETFPDLSDALNRKKNGIKPKSARDIGTPETAKTIIDARTNEPVTREAVAERFQKTATQTLEATLPKEKPNPKGRSTMCVETETRTVTKKVITDNGAKKVTTKKTNGAKKPVKAKAVKAKAVKAKAVKAKAVKEIVKRSVDMATLKKPSGSMTEAVKKMEIRENSFLFDAFQMFMKNPGSPVTFSALMKTIYGNSKSDGPLNLLIFNARKRLKDYKIPMQIATLNKNGERAYGLFAK